MNFGGLGNRVLGFHCGNLVGSSSGEMGDGKSDGSVVVVVKWGEIRGCS